MVVAAIWLIQAINRWLEDAHSKLFFAKYARQFIWLQSSPETWDAILNRDLAFASNRG
jgi:hypothetical protein